MQPDDPTLTPQLIINAYHRAFEKLNGRAPNVRHLGGQWYYVNGETLHRVALMTETMRLRELVKSQQNTSHERGLINRLIAKLRGI
jgi:hypothetical protein